MVGASSTHVETEEEAKAEEEAEVDGESYTLKWQSLDGDFA